MSGSSPSDSSFPGRRDDGRSRPLILIVENDGDIAHLIARTLTAAQHDFLLTSSGQDALRHVETARPDAITLNLDLQDMSGHVLLALLKANPVTRETPVIVIADPGDEQDPLLANAFAVLARPIDRPALRRAVAAALSETNG